MLLLVTFAAACASGPRGASLSSPYRFGWPDASTIRVTERVLRDGDLLHLTYRARLESAPEGYRLRILDGRVEQDGKRRLTDLDATRQSLELGRTAPFLADLTDTLIDRDGRALGCIESDTLLSHAIAMTTAYEKGARTALELAVRDAHRASTAASHCIDRWSAWVGAWVDFEARPGTPDAWASGNIDIGETAPIRVYDTHEGTSPSSPNQVVLRREQEVDASAISRLDDLIRTLTERLSRASGTDISADRIILERATYEGEVDINPRGLRPTSTTWVETLSYTLDGFSRTARTERTWTLRFE
jgi:hypothetical protein